MSDLLLRPVGWILSGPVPGLLASPWTAVPTVTGLCVTAVWAGAGMGSTYDRLAAAARSGLVTTALLVAVVPPPRPAPAPHTHRAPRRAATKTQGGTTHA